MDKACDNSSKRKRFFSKIYDWIKNLVVTVNDKVKGCEADADIYYKSVYHFGHAHFEKVSSAWCSLPRNLVILALYWEYTIMESPFNLLKTWLCRKRCNIFAVWGNRCYFGNKSNQM